MSHPPCCLGVVTGRDSRPSRSSPICHAGELLARLYGAHHPSTKGSWLGVPRSSVDAGHECQPRPPATQPAANQAHLEPPCTAPKQARIPFRSVSRPTAHRRQCFHSLVSNTRPKTCFPLWRISRGETQRPASKRASQPPDPERSPASSAPRLRGIKRLERPRPSAAGSSAPQLPSPQQPHAGSSIVLYCCAASTRAVGVSFTCRSFFHTIVRCDARPRNAQDAPLAVRPSWCDVLFRCRLTRRPLDYLLTSPT